MHPAGVPQRAAARRHRRAARRRGAAARQLGCAAPRPFVALFIDYGPASAAVGDTLQAVRRHEYVDPLAEPGTADLTAHVLFAALADKARAAGLAADGPITQAEFLGGLGIAERATRLMAANPRKAAEIEAGVQRLMAPTGMGQLFKVMAVRSRRPSAARALRSRSARMLAPITASDPARIMPASGTAFSTVTAAFPRASMPP